MLQKESPNGGLNNRGTGGVRVMMIAFMLGLVLV